MPGNINVETSFFPPKKSTSDKFQKTVSRKVKRAVSIVYDNAAQSGYKNNDYGDLPRSKKQLIDLSRFPFDDNGVGDILAHNEEKGDNSVLWHYLDIPEDPWVIGTNQIASELALDTFLLTQRLNLVFLMSPLSHTRFLRFSAYERMLHKNVACNDDRASHNSA